MSVIVPSHGGARRLPVLFAALAAQVDAEWEAVVVIDGDVDDSSAVVDAAAERLPVRRITFEANRGRSAALNAGFAQAQGDVLVRCDDDLVPAPDYVSGHAAAHDGRRVGVVGLYRNVYPETTYARIYGRAWDARFRDEAYRVPPDQAWRYWAGNVSVTRDMWHTVGEYDTTFRAYGWEDVDWGYRLMQAGVPVVLDPALETEHRIAATTTAMRTQRAFYSGAARHVFEEKHHIAAAPTRPVNTWQRIVAGVAAGLDERRAGRIGTLVDSSARLMPDRAAAKVIALAIDAASRAGHRAGTTAGAI
ncbi:glycosyltransferase family 2 protein [Nocardioides oleivorans]|uniref:Glycosyltransferase family 2 protein n=1 Tax=Nocardioides oleivorans TaxID=273676 RepID=A0A4Q2S5N4_9ACTN|nr:glycosyltransferase family 2 protein [Nocardioides oleivorans]